MKKLKHYLASRPSSRKPFQDEDNDNMVSEMLEVDQDSCNPLRAWNRIKKTTDVQKMCPIDPKKPVKENCVRFVCIADTHNRPEKKGYDLSFLPPGDVLLHAGDFTMGGSPGEINLFNSYFGCLPHQIKILIAGNHDVSLDQWVTSPEQHQQSVELLTNFTYLEDSMVEVYGIKIYGSPWVVKCGSWGFVLQRGTPLMNRWNIIPANVDILMTHSPPLGIGDALIGDGYPGGCVDLLNTVQKRVKPKYHVYGHIHEGVVCKQIHS